MFYIYNLWFIGTVLKFKMITFKLLAELYHEHNLNCYLILYPFAINIAYLSPTDKIFKF